MALGRAIVQTVAPPSIEPLADALTGRGFGLRFGLWIIDPGPRRAALVEEVRNLTRESRKDAEARIDRQASILDHVSRERATAARRWLERAGAAVELLETSAVIHAVEARVSPGEGESIECMDIDQRELCVRVGRLGHRDIEWTQVTRSPYGSLDDLLTAIDERRATWQRIGMRELAGDDELHRHHNGRELDFHHQLRMLEGDARMDEANVYADWLQARGDPLGQIAPLIHAASTANTELDPYVRYGRENAPRDFMGAHYPHFFGMYLQHIPELAEMIWWGPVLDTLRLRNMRERDLFDVQLLHYLLASPPCPCLRSLVLECAWTEGADLGEVIAMAPCAASLRELRITLDTVRRFASANVGVTLRGDVFERLESLELVRARSTLGPGRFPALRKLVLDLDVSRSELAEHFVELDTPALTQFELTVHAGDRFNEIGPELAGILALPAFAGLQSLTFGTSIVSPPLPAEFGRVLALRFTELEHVDLQGAPMTRECREELVRGGFARLPALQLR